MIYIKNDIGGICIMDNILNRMKQDINMELLYKLWPDFKRAAFALYDDEYVYVFHHPLFLIEG